MKAVAKAVPAMRRVQGWTEMRPVPREVAEAWGFVRISRPLKLLEARDMSEEIGSRLAHCVVMEEFCEPYLVCAIWAKQGARLPQRHEAIKKGRTWRKCN